MLDEALIGVIEAISQTMFDVEPTLAPLAGSAFDDQALIASVTFSGAFSGELRVTFSERLARVLASRTMRMMPEQAVLAELIDATGELANIIAGNVKGLLPSPSRQSLPCVQRGPRILLAYPCTQLGCALFSLFGEPMWVELTRTQRVLTRELADRR